MNILVYQQYGTIVVESDRVAINSRQGHDHRDETALTADEVCLADLFTVLTKESADFTRPSYLIQGPHSLLQMK